MAVFVHADGRLERRALRGPLLPYIQCAIPTNHSRCTVADDYDPTQCYVARTRYSLQQRRMFDRITPIYCAEGWTVRELVNQGVFRKGGAINPREHLLAAARIMASREYSPVELDEWFGPVPPPRYPEPTVAEPLVEFMGLRLLVATASV